MEKAAFRIHWVRGGVDSHWAIAHLSLWMLSEASKYYFMWRAADKEDCLVAQKEPVLEPEHLCSALFCGKVTRPVSLCFCLSFFSSTFSTFTDSCSSVTFYNFLVFSFEIQEYFRRKPPTGFVHKHRGSIYYYSIKHFWALQDHSLLP